MRFLFCSALLAGFATSLFAQSPATPKKSPPPPGILKSVQVSGNKRYSSAEILKQIGLHPGQRINSADIENARQQLQDLQLFSSVADRFRFGGNPPAYDLTFEVTEIEQVFPMRFERLSVNSTEARDYLRETVPLYSEQIPGTEAVLGRYRQAVQAYVARTNPSLKIKVLPQTDDTQQMAIVFMPDIPPPTISQVKISGNEAIDTGTLLRAINQVAIGAPLTDARLKQICDGAIKQVYASHGFVAVSFPSIQSEPSKTDHGMVVSIQIKEGPTFKFGPVHFHGTGLDPDEVRSAIPFKPGQPYDASKVDDFRIDIQHRLRRRGYLDASVTTEMKPDDATRSVNVTYNVVPGSIYTFAKLDIKGLDLVSEPVIEKMWGEKPGKPFNPDYPDFFLKRIEEDKLFEHLANTSSDYTADSSTHDVVVHLYFKGGESKEELEKKKREEQERKTSDGTWSPY
ncbi:MAG TPA: FtsQ-type POTRA domain-containing protein [Bryobacteraceae bacterium]|nr:FtsQ-type POTRA domain-containing protein [Bryobacteraceae bacterium]